MTAPMMQTLTGPTLELRLIEVADAEYVHGLRTDPTYNRYLSTVTGTVDDQRRWIDAYKAREAAGHEYYYVARRADGLRCGVVRLYDIAETRFTWGSFILDANKPAKAALETALLSFGAGFERLGKSEALVDVRTENTHALAFYRRLGMTQTGADAETLYFVYPRARYAADRALHLSVITGSKT